MSWSYNKLEKRRYKKINTFSKEIITTYNLDLNLESSNKSNINEFQILIIKKIAHLLNLLVLIIKKITI